MDDDDVVELGGSGRLRLPRWPPSRGTGVFMVAALAVGLAAGYAAGDTQRGGGAARPQPTVTVTASPSAPAPAASSSFAGSLALAQDTAACSVQTGHELQLGIQLTNRSPQPVTLTTATATTGMPAGYLKLAGWQWGTCGALAAGISPDALMLEPGQSTWLTATFKVQVRCPGAANVQFTVGYLAQGRSDTAALPGFPDLSQVPYSGCPSNSAAGTSDAIQVQEVF